MRNETDNRPLSSSSSTALEVQKLVKTFGDRRVVNDVSFELQQGEIFGFLGPNGSGKTTTMRMALDLIKPDSGTVSILAPLLPVVCYAESATYRKNGGCSSGRVDLAAQSQPEDRPENVTSRPRAPRGSRACLNLALAPLLPLRRVGYLPEERGLFQRAQVRVLRYMGRLKGLSASTAGQSVRNDVTSR